MPNDGTTSKFTEVACNSTSPLIPISDPVKFMLDSYEAREIVYKSKIEELQRQIAELKQATVKEE